MNSVLFSTISSVVEAASGWFSSKLEDEVSLKRYSVTMLPGMPKVAQTKNAWNVKRRMLTKFHSAVMGLLRSERMKNGEISPFSVLS